MKLYDFGLAIIMVAVMTLIGLAAGRNDDAASQSVSDWRDAASVHEFATCSELTSASTGAEVESDIAECLKDFGWDAHDAIIEARRIVGVSPA